MSLTGDYGDPGAGSRKVGHVAFHHFTVLEKLQVKIEALESWGKKLLAGTQEGVLLIYELKDNPNYGLTFRPHYIIC